MAMTIFMEFDPRFGPFYEVTSAGGSLNTTREARFAGNTVEIESSPVPVAKMSSISLFYFNKICRL